MVFLLFILTAGACLPAAPVTEVVAISGGAAPGGGVFDTTTPFTKPALNNNGSVAFVGRVANFGGYVLCLGNVASLQKVARTGDALFGGTIGGLNNSPALNDADQMLFIATIGNNWHLARSEATAGAFTQLLFGGQPAPDGNGTFSLYSSLLLPALTPSGHATIVVRASNSSGGTNDDSGLYRTGTAGALTKIVREGETVPGGNGKFGEFGDFSGRVMNAVGQAAFGADLINTSGGLNDNVAVYRGDGSTVTQIARRGVTPLPGGGTVDFNGNWAPDMNDSGIVVFRAATANDPTPGIRNILVQGSGGALTEIVRTGTTLPGSPNTFRLINGHPRINNAGQVAFLGSTGNSYGLFRYQSNGTEGITIARDGQAPPNGVGAFAMMSSALFDINESGQVAFLARCDNSADGDSGIFFYDSGTGLVQVARKNQPLLGSTIASFGLSFAGSNGTRGSGSSAPIAVVRPERSGLNNRGQVTFGFLLTDGRDGIAIWSPTGTPTPTPTPGGTPTPGQLANISTRLRVETDDNVLIGGFIVTGTQPKRVILRAIGPSLTAVGVQGALADPTLELHDSSGVVLDSNDNWRDAPNRQEIIDSTLAPADNLESAILMTLPANNSGYTAVVRGANNSTGVGLVEVYDLDLAADSRLANISTRGLVRTGDAVMIGGFIVAGQNSTRVIVRAIGPSLSVSGNLADPTLELHDGDGALIASNDNWRSDQQAEIVATGIPPSNDLESAIVRTLAPGGYTAIVSGVANTTGVALVEVYQLNN